MTSLKLLCVEDQIDLTESIKLILKPFGFNTSIARTGREGLNYLVQFEPDLVLLDYQMPEMTGLEFIRAAKSIYPKLPIITMTAFNDKAIEKSFLDEGAFGFIEKPFNIDELKHLIQKAINQINKDKSKKIVKRIESEFPNIIASSDVMKTIFKQVSLVAKTTASVLILGNSGTGKELIADAIHSKSLRHDGPLIKVNCGAIPEALIESELFGHEQGAFTGAMAQKKGRFEQANKGTLFLDEIGELPLNMQVKLLRVLQEHRFERVGGSQTIKVDIRIVAATNCNLEEMVAKKAFREDLYFRLNCFPIKMPNLKQRDGDIELLANHFIVKYSKEYQKKVTEVSSQLLNAFKKYNWPGNIRELENKIARAVILTDSSRIGLSDCHLSHQSEKDQLDKLPDELISEAELVKRYARKVYEFCNFKKKDTLEILDINFKTLKKRLAD